MSKHPNHRRGEKREQDHGPSFESHTPAAGCNSTHVARARTAWKRIGARQLRRTGKIRSVRAYNTKGLPSVETLMSEYEDGPDFDPRTAVLAAVIHYLEEDLKGDELLMKEVWEACSTRGEEKKAKNEIKAIITWLKARAEKLIHPDGINYETGVPLGPGPCNKLSAPPGGGKCERIANHWGPCTDDIEYGENSRGDED